MKTRTIIWSSALAGTGLAWAYVSETAAIVAFSAHVIGYFLHHVEVKLNKLLDHHGIRVTDKELAE
jgi:hypothetical protein